MKYHKIQSIFKRDPATKHKTFLPEYTTWAFDYLKDNEWTWTEKVDGMNMRVIWDGEVRRFAGRGDNAQIPSNLMEHMYDKFPEKMFEHMMPLTLYGEGYGAGIQKVGSMYGENQQFILFDVLRGDKWMSRLEVEEFGRELGIPFTPIVGVGTLLEAVDLVKRNPPSGIGDGVTEGLVCRPSVELRDRDGSRIITKVKCRDYL
jgi:hypothetical protein